ncbi:hypothetical protein Ciccas_012350, partial [Cichlidogyrus casuarinus]
MQLVWKIILVAALIDIAIVYWSLSVDDEIASQWALWEQKRRDISDYPMQFDLSLLENPKIHLPIRPINDQNVSFLMQPKVQIDNVSFTALILIKSAPQNAHNRSTLRETWFQDLRKFNCRAYFLLGLSAHYEQELVAQEAHRYNDIIQANFHDHYRSLTKKLISGLTWQKRLSFNYLIITDDDYFVNVKNLAHYLQIIGPKEDFISGNLIAEAKPDRDPES